MRLSAPKNGREALEIFKTNREKINMVLLDMVMPVMDGTECFYQLKRTNQDVKVVMSSGFTRDADLGILKSDGLADFIRKPYSMEKLSQVVARVVNNQS